jgi:hypothetical protein
MAIINRHRVVGMSALALALCAGRASAQNTQCGGPGLVSAPDLAVGVLTGPQNYTATGGFDALSIGTTSCNMGNINVQWNACNSVTHPVIGGNLYRWSTVNGATRFEQVGLSWLKHAFTALTNSDCCSCNGQGGSVLGVGCSDPYTAGRNGSQSGLGPRGEVNAFTGSYTSATCGHHPSGNNNGRLEVNLNDLVNTSGGSTATTRYFGESQYINHDDAIWSDVNHPAGWLSMNNASYIEVTVSGTSTEHSFAFLGSTQRFKSAIEAWKLIDPTVTQSVVIVDGEGKYIVSSKATSIGNGLWHYEYAVYNMNSDRSGGTFSVPIIDAVGATNIGFHGVIYRGGDGVTFGTNYDSTNWPGNKANGAITWATTPFATNANANAIRWGTTYNFRFDTPLPPAAATGRVTLGLFKPGTPTSVDVAAVVPGMPTCGSADFDHNGDAGTDADIEAFFACLAGNCCASCGSTDFNGDGDFGTDGDIESFFRVLAGGPC